MKDNFAEKAAFMDSPVRVEMAHRFVSELRERIDLHDSMHIVDLGCGTGLVGLQLAREVAAVTMIDSSPTMLEILERKITEREVTNISVRMGELSNYGSEPVDSIIALLVAHHIEDTKLLFKQAHENLKSGGRFIIGDLVTEDGSFHEGESVPHNGFDLDEISSIATDTGFRKVEAARYDTRHKNGKDFPLFILIAVK